MTDERHEYHGYQFYYTKGEGEFLCELCEKERKRQFRKCYTCGEMKEFSEATASCNSCWGYEKEELDNCDKVKTFDNETLYYEICNRVYGDEIREALAKALNINN